MSERALRAWLVECQATEAFIDLVPSLLDAVPSGAEFASETWDVTAWLIRPGPRQRFNLDFRAVRNSELRQLAKVWVLHSRLAAEIGPAACRNRLSAVRALNHVLDARSFRSATSDDFKAAGFWLATNYGAGTAFRAAGFLQQLAGWLTRTFNVHLNYRNRLRNPIVHGRYGTEAGRETKLIPTEVLRDLVAANSRSDLSTKDQFYLAALTVNIAAGFRIAEMSTMPFDCVDKTDGGLQLLYYPEKGGVAVPRPIHPKMAAAVVAAIDRVLAATARGRKLAWCSVARARLDWPRIVRDHEAFRYFVATWAHQWTSNPLHQLINPKGAWYGPECRFIDAIGALKAAGGNRSLAARNLGLKRNTFYHLMDAQVAARDGKLARVKNNKRFGAERRSWDTDARVISFLQLERHISLTLRQDLRRVVRDVLKDAQTAQLQGQCYPAPKRIRELERRYRYELRPLIRDRRGRAVLHAHDSLFVIEQYALSEQRRTRHSAFSTLTSRHFSRWLSGESRARGTGNHEDSVLRRLRIVDPRTNDIARFTWHDIRHWLDTIYENGGLTQDQIALIFGRQASAQNRTYDQTSNKTRVERVRKGIREGMVIGHAATTYHRLADVSRDEAESYLAAVSRMISLMPHGLCMLDWARTTCPHYLSCFSSDSERAGPCEHLLLDPHNGEQIEEIRRLRRESELSIRAHEAQGGTRQAEYFRTLQANYDIALGQAHTACVNRTI